MFFVYFYFKKYIYRTSLLLLWKYLNKQFDKLASLRLMSGNLNSNANEKFARQERGWEAVVRGLSVILSNKFSVREKSVQDDVLVFS